jgi:cytochrome c oxidase subunit I+III
MSGGLHDVKNEVWMRTVVIGITLIVIGVVAYGAFTGGIASVKHHEWEDTIEPYEEAHEAKIDASNELALAKSQWNNDGQPSTGVLYDNYVEAEANYEAANEFYDEAHHHKVDAHLSYLTWATAGKTIMVMFLIYGAFYIVAGFVNSIQPEPEHHGHDDDHEEHHGSASPILMASGLLLIMMSFPGFADTAKSMLGINIEPDYGDFSIFCIGGIILMAGIGNWWREDLIGHEEQISYGQPFGGQDVRKAGMWIFLISEMMVFASFFSSYLRMRTEWCTQWAVDAGRCTTVDTTTASDLLRGDIMTLLPGAINTFALIISSYTIVQALKTSKDTNWKRSENVLLAKMFPTRKKAVRNYLIITLGLGSLFILLKLIEWSHLIAEGFDIGTQAGSIFYVATGAHGLHVFIGLIVMLFMVFKADTVGYDENNGRGIEYFGLYWHFVDLAWVAIFPAFYLY